MTPLPDAVVSAPSQWRYVPIHRKGGGYVMDLGVAVRHSISPNSEQRFVPEWGVQAKEVAEAITLGGSLVFYPASRDAVTQGGTALW